MLVIRMQRTGRKGHAMFRVVVQDSRRTPTSGKIVAALGSYDPHAKNVILNKEKAEFYLAHGAQPSDRVAMLLQKEGVTLPTWVTPAVKKTAAVRNLEKLRRNRPAEEVVEAPAAEEPAADEAVVEETAAPEAPAEEPAAEASEAAPEAEAAEEAPAADAEASEDAAK